MNPRCMPSISRRALLQKSLFSGTLWFSGFERLLSPDLLTHHPEQAHHDASLLGVMPFAEEGHPPIGEPIGSELDGRLFTDLSTLTPENPLTPTDQFFIRSRASRLLDSSRRWTINLGGAIEKPLTVTAEALTKKARPMGTHLIECAGNARAARFGMLSIAEWEGVPVKDILETVNPSGSSLHVMISGFDRYQEESMTSEPGASWIFTPDQLFSAQAFLATRINGQPLGLDHGAPVRLVVPGWYGCVCIKWVNQIDFVSEDAPATSQMQEYAERTMQTGVPSLARRYQPAEIDAAAMPTRIEKWSMARKIRYRVSGIQWGSPRPGARLEIRFNPTDPFLPVENLEAPPAGNITFWTYEWTPPKPGRFTIRLRLAGAKSPTRRLDSGYYDRSVDIAEV